MAASPEVESSRALLTHIKNSLLWSMDCACALSPRSLPMLDLLMIALGLGFFALSVGYTIACDRL